MWYQDTAPTGFMSKHTNDKPTGSPGEAAVRDQASLVTQAGTHDSTRRSQHLPNFSLLLLRVGSHQPLAFQEHLWVLDSGRLPLCPP
jgi:hypothetical protein